jgi:cAMP-dependent protein kinase regulator
MGFFGGGGRDEIAESLAKKDYERAIKLLKQLVAKEPANVTLRVQLGDAHAMAGQNYSAISIYDDLASELAEGGFVAKAIAVLKKIQRIEPGRLDVEERVADLVRQKDAESNFRSQLRTTPRAREATGTVPIVPQEPTPAPQPTAPSVPAAPPQPKAPEEKVVLTPLFGEFSRDEFVAVMRGLRLRSYEPGDILVSEGEVGGSLFIITSGRVGAWVKDQSGRFVKVRELSDGDFFGEISVLTGKPRTATVTAAAQCECLELDKPTLDAITVTHPHVRTVMEEFYRLRAGSVAETAARRGST